MASIVGEKYRYATTAELNDLDSRIAKVQAQYNDIKAKFSVCADGKNRSIFYSCNKNVGYSYRELQNLKKSLVKQLETLQKQREALVATVMQTTQLTTDVAAATTKVAEATEAVGKGVGSVALYGLLAVAAIIGGVMLYKKVKK
jgi:K+/H+ antiporter YhaU regulatory subunit KhtT